MMGDGSMNESRDALSVSQSPEVAAPNTLTFDERWARWQEKGARHDARVDRNMRVLVAIAMIALTVAAIWVSVSPR